MPESISQRDAIWNDFLMRWPLETLPQMQLFEYSKAGNKDCFTYWLEARTQAIGSMWGGSAFKFGIFGRKNLVDKPAAEGLSYSADYKWASKYGSTPEEAFESVRREVVRVANAARSGDLKTIDAADLGHVTKWKIAFLYQDRAAPSIINIFKLDHLRSLVASSGKSPASDLQKTLIGDIPVGQHVLEMGDEYWSRIQESEAALITTVQAQTYLEESGRFTSIKPSTQYIAGYRNSEGRELALARDNKRVTLYLSDGPWLPQVSEAATTVVRYSAEKPRSSNLAANAPTLAIGNPIVKVTIDSQASLSELCDAYEGSDISAQIGERAVRLKQNATSLAGIDAIPLNQILYGPPGTGKTFRTVEEALRIVDPGYLGSHIDDRASQKLRFDEHVLRGSIRFVTFHQSFNYEDFVEGIRAVPDDNPDTSKTASGGPRFEVVPGIFKQMCDEAVVQVAGHEAAPPDLERRRIWKMSLGDSETEGEIYQACIKEGYALLGWGDQIDFTGVGSIGDVARRFEAAGEDVKESDYAVKAVATFVSIIQTGDLMLITDGNLKFRAFGEVTGGYEFAPNRVSGYAQSRRMRWLRVWQPSLPWARIMDKQFSQRTLYELNTSSLSRERLSELLAESAQPEASEQSSAGALPPKVLIIDEINRGNVSRVFGELITLIENSKRQGMAEALELILPYSKERFSVPSNVYLIGTMNTADRSLTSLDNALRRRFSFLEVPPQPGLLDDVVVDDIEIGELLRVINARIEALLDRDHCIGHSYFLPLKADGSLRLLADIFRRQIFPLLEEYFFEDWSRIRLVLNDHRKKDHQIRFVRPASDSLESLFGPVEDLPLQRDRWSINEDAFKFAESYLEIIDAK